MTASGPGGRQVPIFLILSITLSISLVGIAYWGLLADSDGRVTLASGAGLARAALHSGRLPSFLDVFIHILIDLPLILVSQTPYEAQGVAFGRAPFPHVLGAAFSTFAEGITSTFAAILIFLFPGVRMRGAHPLFCSTSRDLIAPPVARRVPGVPPCAP